MYAAADQHQMAPMRCTGSHLCAAQFVHIHSARCKLEEQFMLQRLTFTPVVIDQRVHSSQLLVHVHNLAHPHMHLPGRGS